MKWLDITNHVPPDNEYCIVRLASDEENSGDSFYAGAVFERGEWSIDNERKDGGWEITHFIILDSIEENENLEIQPISISELIRRCDKMSYLLGLATGSLLELIKDESLPMFKRGQMIDSLTHFREGIDELYYKDKLKNEQ